MDEPLVLLPGMNCSARLWAGVESALRRELPALDVRHGSLNADTIDGCVDALLATLPSRFALAGLSLGGIVAMALLRRASDRVSRVCLMATNPRAPSDEQRVGWESQRRALAAGRTACDLQRDLLAVLLSRSARTPQLERMVLRMADDVGTPVLDRQLRAQGTRIDERPFLPGVRVPSLVIAGTDDALCRVAWHEEMAELIPESRLAVLDGVGHLGPLEAPELVAGHLTDWLSSPHAGGGRRPSTRA